MARISQWSATLVLLCSCCFGNSVWAQEFTAWQVEQTKLYFIATPSATTTSITFSFPFGVNNESFEQQGLAHLASILLSDVNNWEINKPHPEIVTAPPKWLAVNAKSGYDTFELTIQILTDYYQALPEIVTQLLEFDIKSRTIFAEQRYQQQVQLSSSPAKAYQLHLDQLLATQPSDRWLYPLAGSPSSLANITWPDTAEFLKTHMVAAGVEILLTANLELSAAADLLQEIYAVLPQDDPPPALKHDPTTTEAIANVGFVARVDSPDQLSSVSFVGSLPGLKQPYAFDLLLLLAGMGCDRFGWLYFQLVNTVDVDAIQSAHACPQLGQTQGRLLGVVVVERERAVEVYRALLRLFRRAYATNSYSQDWIVFSQKIVAQRFGSELLSDQFAAAKLLQMIRFSNQLAPNATSLAGLTARLTQQPLRLSNEVYQIFNPDQMTFQISRYNPLRQGE